MDLSPDAHIPAHSPGHLDCPACEQARTVLLCHIVPELTFHEASELWLKSRSLSHLGRAGARYIRPTTEASYAAYIRSLSLFFGQLRLEQIHLGHLRQYQEARLIGAPPFVRYRRPQDASERRLPDGSIIPAKGKTPCPATPKKVNQELSVLKTILRRAGAWNEELGEFYERLGEEEGELRRILTPDEQHRWLTIAASRAEWALVYWYSILAFSTSMGTNEMRSLRIGDVDLAHRVVSVPPQGSKNRYRTRSITIDSAEAMWAAEQLLRRAADLGAAEPIHYLFPLRPRGSHSRLVGQTDDFDPTRPMTLSGMKKGWEAVRNAARLKWFSPYDTRSTAITRWAENGVAAEVMRMRTGHVSDRMMRHYIRIYEGAQRKAMANVPSFGPVRDLAPVYVMRRRA